MKTELKEVDKQYKLEKEDYKLMDKLQGSTTQNENTEKYEKLQTQLNIKREVQEQKLRRKEEIRQQKLEQKQKTNT